MSDDTILCSRAVHMSIKKRTYDEIIGQIEKLFEKRLRTKPLNMYEYFEGYERACQEIINMLGQCPAVESKDNPDKPHPTMAGSLQFLFLFWESMVMSNSEFDGRRVPNPKDLVYIDIIARIERLQVRAEKVEEPDGMNYYIGYAQACKDIIDMFKICPRCKVELPHDPIEINACEVVIGHVSYGGTE